MLGKSLLKYLVKMGKNDLDIVISNKVIFLL